MFSCIAEWSAADRAGQQFSSRIVFWAPFCWKMLIQWYQDALWEHVNAIKAISRSQTSAQPPCLLPSWLSRWDSWATMLQPAACLIFLYLVVSLFVLHFPFILTFIFYIQYTCSTRKYSITYHNIKCQIKVTVSQWV